VKLYAGDRFVIITLLKRPSNLLIRHKIHKITL